MKNPNSTIDVHEFARILEYFKLEFTEKINRIFPKMFENRLI